MLWVTRKPKKGRDERDTSEMEREEKIGNAEAVHMQSEYNVWYTALYMNEQGQYI